MATLYVTEYATLGESSKGTPNLPEEPPVAEQTVAIGGGSIQSSQFNAKTRVIRLHTDTVCSILVGTNPVVTTSNQRMAANQTEYKALLLVGNPPPQMKVAVIANT